MVSRRSFLVGASAAAATVALPRVAAAATRSVQVTFIGDSVGRRGSMASTVAKTWQSRVSASLRPLGRVRLGKQYFVNDERGNTVISSVYDVSSGDDLTFVMIGTNDVREGASPLRFRTDYAHLLDLVRERSPNTQLICLGLWLPSDGAPFCTRVEMELYHAAIAELAVAHGARAVIRLEDIYDAEWSRYPKHVRAFGGYYTDGFHPNDAGHRAIYQRVVDTLGSFSQTTGS